MDVNKTVQRSNGKVLRIASHALVKVPQSVFQLVGLVELDLSSNSISELSSQIKCLHGLQILKLSWNSLIALPDELCSLGNLQVLAVEFNKLTYLPQNIGKLTKLRTVLANDNKITHIPESISQLKELSELNLQYNSLGILPNSLCLAGSKCGGLRVLTLTGNPLLYPPMDIVVEGTRSILQYLRRQHVGGQSSGSSHSLEKQITTNLHRHTYGSSPSMKEDSDLSTVNVEEYKYTKLHREVEELIEKISTDGRGTNREGGEGSPSTSTSTNTNTIGRDWAMRSPGSMKNRPGASNTSSSPHLRSGRALFTNTNRSSPSQTQQRNVSGQAEKGNLLGCITSVSPGSGATSSSSSAFQSPQSKRQQDSFPRTLFSEQRVLSTKMQAPLNLEECLTVHGGGRQSKATPTRTADESREGERERVSEVLHTTSANALRSPVSGNTNTRNMMPGASAAQPEPVEEVNEEYLGIVHNLLRQRNPALAESFGEIVRSGEETPESSSSEEENEDEDQDEDEQLKLRDAYKAKSSPNLDTSKLPKEFLCPITHDVMRDPVVLSDGHTYERQAIEKWIKLGRTTSPMTGATLTSTSLTPNFTLRSMIVSKLKSV